MKKQKRDVFPFALEQVLKEHTELEQRLKSLNKRAYLTPAEQEECKVIKKLKLVKKDQIAILTRTASA